MRGPRPIYYYKSKPGEARVFEYKKWRERVLEVAAAIIERKRAAQIVPARASWRELQDVLRPCELEQVGILVEQGRLRKFGAINYDTYDIVEMNEEQT